MKLTLTTLSLRPPLLLPTSRSFNFYSVHAPGPSRPVVVLTLLDSSSTGSDPSSLIMSFLASNVNVLIFTSFPSSSPVLDIYGPIIKYIRTNVDTNPNISIYARDVYAGVALAYTSPFNFDTYNLNVQFIVRSRAGCGVGCGVG